MSADAALRVVDAAAAGEAQLEDREVGREAADLAAFFAREKLDALGGVRQLIGKYIDANPDFRLLPDSFMEIRQAMGTKPGRTIGARYLRAFVEEMKASGFVADALKRSGQSATVAPAEA